uniref:hypothetical protein n=1 Tax=Hydrotalea sp. TaxID=2881279 RepID=UPI002631E319
GLAWAIIGGLISSLFLTLIIVPVIYSLAEGLRDKMPALFSSVFHRKKKEAAGNEEDLGLLGK